MHSKHRIIDRLIGFKLTPPNRKNIQSGMKEVSLSVGECKAL